MTDSPPCALTTLELGPMENFVYLLTDRASGRVAVVDPAWDVPAIREAAERHGARITDVLLTHSHNDHVNGVGELLRHHDAEVHLLKDEAEFWQQTGLPVTAHHGGDVIRLGATEITVLHTPGHTPGSACYRTGNDLLTGDTLFVFGCGRCDLKGGDPHTMYETLRRIAALPSGLVIRPGHHYAHAHTSTIGEQVEGNPFLHFTDVDRFLYYRMQWHDRHRDSPYGPVRNGEEMPPEG